MGEYELETEARDVFRASTLGKQAMLREVFGSCDKFPNEVGIRGDHSQPLVIQQVMWGR